MLPSQRNVRLVDKNDLIAQTHAIPNFILLQCTMVLNSQI